MAPASEAGLSGVRIPPPLPVPLLEQIPVPRFALVREPALNAGYRSKAMGWTPPHLPASMCQTGRLINQSREKESKIKIIRVGVDLAKNVFQVHGVDRNEKPVWQRKLNRAEWLKVLLEKIEPGCEIGMEACGSAHHWA